MTAQFLHAHSSRNQPQRYTLVFRDGQLLRHQDALTLAQYRSDARLAEVRPEVPIAEGHGYNLQTYQASSY